MDLLRAIVTDPVGMYKFFVPGFICGWSVEELLDGDMPWVGERVYADMVHGIRVSDARAGRACLRTIKKGGELYMRVVERFSTIHTGHDYARAPDGLEPLCHVHGVPFYVQFTPEDHGRVELFLNHSRLTWFEMPDSFFEPLTHEIIDDDHHILRNAHLVFDIQYNAPDG